MGFRIAHNLSASNILDYIEIAGDLRIVEIAAIDAWAGKSLVELNFRKKYGTNIIAIKKPNGQMNAFAVW